MMSIGRSSFFPEFFTHFFLFLIFFWVFTLLLFCQSILNFFFRIISTGIFHNNHFLFHVCFVSIGNFFKAFKQFMNNPFSLLWPFFFEILTLSRQTKTSFSFVFGLSFTLLFDFLCLAFCFYFKTLIFTFLIYVSGGLYLFLLDYECWIKFWLDRTSLSFILWFLIQVLGGLYLFL